MVRRLGITLFAVLAALGLLAAGALVWATSESGSGTISEKLRETLREEAGLEVGFRDIDVEVFPPRIRIVDVTATDAAGVVSCSVEEAEVSPDLMDLIGGDLTVEEIYVGSPACTVRLDAGSMDALRDLAGGPGGGDLDLSALPEFEVFALSDGRLSLSVEDPEGIGAAVLSVEGLGLDVTGTDGEMEVRGLVEEARARWEKGGKVVDEEISGLSFRAGVSSAAVDVRHLDAQVAGASVRLRDAHVPFPLWPRGPSVADLSLQVPLDALGRFPVDLPAMSGAAGFLGQASAREESDGEVGLTARGRVSLSGVRVDEFVVGDLDGLVSLNPRGVAFAEVELRTAEGRLVIDGNVAFDEELSSDLTVRLDRIELANLLENLTVTGAYVMQRMSGVARARGQLRPLRLDGTVRLDVDDHRTFDRSFRADGKETLLAFAHATVNGKIRATDERFSAYDLDTRVGSTRVVVDTDFQFGDEGWQLVARSEDLYLDDLGRIAGLSVAGHGPVTCRIRDRMYGDPRIVGSASFSGFEIAGYSLGAVSTGVRFEGRTLAFDGLTVKGRQSRCSTRELRLDFDPRHRLLVETIIDAEQVAVEEVVRIFDLDAELYGSPEGFVFGRVALNYDAREDDLRLEGDLAHGGLNLFGEQFGPDVLRFLWSEGDLTLHELGLTKGGGVISVTGALSEEGAVNLVAIATDVQIGEITFETVYDLELSATAQAFVVVEGTLDHPVGWADVRIGETVRRGARYGPSHVNLELDGSVLVGRGRIAGDLLNLEHGLIDLSRERFEIEAFARDIDPLEALGIEVEGHRTRSRLTGEVSLGGRLAAEPRMRGRAEIRDLMVSIDDFEVAGAEPIRISVANDGFALRRARFRGPDLVFDISGSGGLDEVDLAVKGIADLGAVSEVVDPVDESSGRLVFEVRATGPWRDPALRGQALLEAGRLRVQGFPHAIEGVEGQVLLGTKAIRFTGFTARSAGGSMELEGQLSLTGLEVGDYRFRMLLDGLELEPLEDFSFVASTSGRGLVLEPGRDGGIPTVTGDLEIEKARYTRDIRMIEISDLTVDRLTGTKAELSKPQILDEEGDAFAFDVGLHGSRRLEVRNNLLDVDLRIDDVEDPLRLVGTNQIFGLEGRILATEGQVRFAGQRFDVRYGALSFRDPLRPDNPHFRVTADGQVRDWKVTITAEGTVEEYEIKLSSQPYLSKEDLVFLLLTGMTRAEHRQFGSSGVAGLGAPLLDQIGPGGEIIPLELRIYNEYSEAAGTDTTRVSIGKRVTEDIWVAVSSSLGQEREIQANLEYKISDNLSVFADYENDNESQMGNLGVDLKFRLEF